MSIGHSLKPARSLQATSPSCLFRLPCFPGASRNAGGGLRRAALANQPTDITSELGSEAARA